MRISYAREAREKMRKIREMKEREKKGLTLRLSLAVRDAGRVCVRLRAVRYRGGNCSGCRSCGCCSRCRVRPRCALLLLSILQITRIQQRRKIPRLIHTADNDAVRDGVMFVLLLRLPVCVPRRRDTLAVDAQQSHRDVDRQRESGRVIYTTRRGKWRETL